MQKKTSACVSVPTFPVSKERLIRLGADCCGIPMQGKQSPSLEIMQCWLFPASQMTSSITYAHVEFIWRVLWIRDGAWYAINKPAFDPEVHVHNKLPLWVDKEFICTLRAHLTSANIYSSALGVKEKAGNNFVSSIYFCSGRFKKPGLKLQPKVNRVHFK